MWYFEAIGVYWPRYLHVFQLCIFPIHGCHRFLSNLFMPFLDVIYVNVTSTASSCISCIKYVFFFPVLVVNWVSYVSPTNIISRRSTPFYELEFLGLVFVFSCSLVFRSPASISFSFWFVSISSSFLMPSSSNIFSEPSFSMVASSWSFWFWFLMMLLLGSFSLCDGCSYSYVSFLILSSSSPFSVMSSPCSS